LAEGADRTGSTGQPFEIKVRSPEGLAFEGKVAAVRLPVPDGDLGVLARHAPMVAALRCGLLRVVHPDGKRETMAIGDGFAQVANGMVRLTVHFLDFPERIDRDRAHRAMGRALQRLRSTAEDEGWDLVRAESALCRSVARLASCGCGCATCSTAKFHGVR
jgi:F-type H+-transporting ATPase subunit epsilon